LNRGFELRLDEPAWYATRQWVPIAMACIVSRQLLILALGHTNLDGRRTWFVFPSENLANVTESLSFQTECLVVEFVKFITLVHCSMSPADGLASIASAFDFV